MELTLELTPKEMISKIIKKLKYAGCSPKENSFITSFFGHLIAFYAGIAIILLMVNMIVFANTNTINYIEDFSFLSGVIQINCKFYTAINNRKKISNMLDTLWNDFWSVDDVNNESKQKALDAYKRVKFFCYLYNKVFVSTFIIYHIHIYLKGNRAFIHEIWVPNKDMLRISPTYEIIYFLQTITMFHLLYFCLIPMDQMFIQFVVFTYIQLKMIQEKIRDFDKETMSFKAILSHHNIILSFLKNFGELYSKILFLNTMANYIIISSSMYGIVVEETLNRKISNICLYAATSVQIFIYCLAGQLIENQSSMICEYLYNSEWYNYPKSLKQDILIGMIRSQNGIKLTAGGFMFLNMENFAAVIRTTFSFLTFLINIKK